MGICTGVVAAAGLVSFVLLRPSPEPLSVATEQTEEGIKIDTNGDGTPDTVVGDDGSVTPDETMAGDGNGQNSSGNGSGSSNGDTGQSGGNGGDSPGGSGNGGSNGGSGGTNGSCAYPNFPNASCTGVPAGVTLTPSGSLTITTPGTVIDAKLITGTVTIQASNVTIKRSKILPGNNRAINVQSGNVIVEDVEIAGELPNGGVVSSPAVAVCCGNYTLKRVNIHGMYEGPRVGSNVIIEDSYIHHLVRCVEADGDNCHIDTLQTTAGSNIIVRHNTILPYNDATDDPLNSAYIVKADTGAIDNVLVEQNYLNGGNYTVYAQSAAHAASNITFRNNHFGRDYRFGPKSTSGVANLIWENNVWADNGQTIP